MEPNELGEMSAPPAVPQHIPILSPIKSCSSRIAQLTHESRIHCLTWWELASQFAPFILVWCQQDLKKGSRNWVLRRRGKALKMSIWLRRFLHMNATAEANHFILRLGNWMYLQKKSYTCGMAQGARIEFRKERKVEWMANRTFPMKRFWI